MFHKANDLELSLIDKVVRKSESEFVLVRITETMLNKSIIDANRSIVNLMKQFNYFDYDLAIDGEIYYLPIKILTKKGWVVNTTSLYRPKAKPTKKGDPRFWPKGIRSVLTASDLLLITISKNSLILIPLIEELICDEILDEEFPKQNIEQLLAKSYEQDLSISEPHKPYDINHWLKNLIWRMRENFDRWILSCSPTRNNPKDVGDTLEAEFGLSVNNSTIADFNGIELKTKRHSSKTADTLFSQIPDEDLTPLKTSKNIILTYGYPSRNPKRQGYNDLFVTVSNKPNPQGLYLKVNEEEQIVEMRCLGNDKVNPKDHMIAGWNYHTLKKRLLEKHPVTAWILASEKIIDGNFHFRYDRLEISKTPLFSQFLLLIERGIVVYDWRGGYEPHGKGRVDKGHPFRLKGAKNRNLLFGELEVIELDSHKDSVSIKE